MLTAAGYKRIKIAHNAVGEKLNVVPQEQGHYT